MKNKIKRQLARLMIVFMVMPIFFAAKTDASAAKWWDKLGAPKYGGSIAIASKFHVQNFDVSQFDSGEWQLWHEHLFDPDWTTDRKKWSFSGDFTPDQYWQGILAESWKMTDPKTIVVKLRKGVRWQNKAPANGREFTSDDVIQHYDRLFGTGSGYTKPNPMFAGMLSSWEKVYAPDKYTVVFKFKTPSAGIAFQSIADGAVFNMIESPESLKEQGGQLKDWEKAVGTGAWMLSDYVTGSSLTFTKNPDYWGADPRHPRNKVPYIDKLTMLVIPDQSTRIAALRTGKVDVLTEIDLTQAQALRKSSPDLKQAKLPYGASGVSFRLDKKPFNDINVRKALQMALSREEIAKGYYKGTVSGTPCGIMTQEYKGYAFAYKDWSRKLKDEYSYNVKEAKKLLAKAGYPNGFKTNCEAATRDDLQLLQIIKAYFQAIGVDMEIITKDITAHQGIVRTGKHDQMLTFGGAHTWPPTRVIDQFFSKSPDRGMTGVNDAGYDNLRNKFWTSGNPAEAAKAMVNADRYIIEQHWMILAPEYYTYNIWQPRVKGYSGERISWRQGYLYSRLWLDQSSKK